jgi:hypothetical protein
MADEKLPEGFFGKEHIPSWIKLGDLKELHPNALQQALRSAERWKEKYGFNKKLTIKYMEPVHSTNAFGSSTIRQEEAEGGLIVVSNQPDIKNIVLHAMTHASRPEESTVLEQSLIGSGGEILAFTGLTIAIHLADKPNEIRYFSLFEEGMAERNAASFKDYPASDPIYHALGLTTLRYFPHSEGNKDHELVVRSDVPNFVRRILNIPESQQVGAEDVFHAISLYSEVYKRADQLHSQQEVLVEFGPKTWK